MPLAADSEEVEETIGVVAWLMAFHRWELDVVILRVRY